MNTAEIIRHIKLYEKNPDLVKELSYDKLAKLILVVLGAVDKIEQSLETKRLDVDAKFSKQTKALLDKAEKDQAAMLAEIQRVTRELLTKSDSLLGNTASELERRVAEAIQNLRDGEDGVVSDDEIQRAAAMAASLVDLPDFDELVDTKITSNPEAVRNALELLQGEERYKVLIEDVDGLSKALDNLAQIRAAGGGNGIGKNQVYNFIRQAIADGTISTGGAATLSELDDVNDTAPSANQVLTWNSVSSEWEPADPPGASGGEANTVSNLGTGEGLYSAKVGVDLRFKSLVAGDDVSLSSDANTVTVNSTVDISGKQNILSEGAFVNGDKTKLDGIAAGAEVNVNADWSAGSGDAQILNKPTLGTAAAAATTDFATAAQGGLADTSVQPGDLATVATTGAYSDLSGTPDLSGYQTESVVVSGSLTAVLDSYYVNVATATYTDPSPTEGKGFIVFVRNATATVGGTGYSTAGTIIHRIFHSGSWSNYVYQVASTFQPLDSDLTAIAAANNGSVLAATTASFTTADETKLDGIETGADVTDTANVTAAGALMDSEVTDLTFVKALSDADASTLNTGTSTTAVATADSLAGSYAGTKSVVLHCVADATDVATGDGVAYTGELPDEVAGMNLIDVKAKVRTAGTTGTTDIQIHNVTQAADMLSTKLTIDSGETSSSTAATAAVIDTANDDITAGDELRIDVDAVSTTAPQGLYVTLTFRLP